MSDIKITPKQYNKLNISTQFGEYLYQRLPKVYRDYDVNIERLNPNTNEVETFRTLEEYLKSFALGGFQPLLEDLEAIINLVDPLKCPIQFLPYLLQHFGLDYIDDIPEKFQRRLVQNIVTLYKKKGTIPAVAFLARELSGFGVTIEEKSDGTVEFALVKLDAYEDEDAELLLAQGVIQRYIHLFLPARSKSKIIVVYGFTENIHINAPDKAKEDDFDHAYYNVDEFVDSIIIDENGYKNTEGGYKEAFDYLDHVVEADFERIKLRLEEETHNFQPSLVDLTSLTNNIENDGLPVFTNGFCCEDTIKTGTVTLKDGVEAHLPSTGVATIEKLGGSGYEIVLPICKVTTDLHAGDVLKFTLNGKDSLQFKYIRLDRDLYASEEYPTTFQIDDLNGFVKIYNQYYTETIDGSYDFKEFSGYSRYYTTLRNGNSGECLTSDIRISCDYDKPIVAVKNQYSKIVANRVEIVCATYSQFYLALKDGIMSIEEAKKFVTEHPITIIAPASPTSRPVGATGYTVAYKRLSNVSSRYPNAKTLDCSVITLEDRYSVFSYKSPIFTQSSQVGVKNSETKEWSYYSLGIPLVSFGGYSESIEKHGEKYYLKSAIKEISLKQMYDGYATGGSSDVSGVSTADWFGVTSDKLTSLNIKFPIYFNMCPCGYATSNSMFLQYNVYNKDTGKYEAARSNSLDAWDYFCIRGAMSSITTPIDPSISPYGKYVFETNRIRALSGYTIETMTYEQYEHLWNEMFKYSDIPPKFYICDTKGYFGGETLTEITDPDVINKLNLLPIPEDCVIINSKGTDFAQIELSINSKLYY